MKGKQVIFPERNKVRVDEVDFDVDHPAPGELVLRNLYSFVSAGTELACLRGQEPEWFHFPQSPGYNAVGEVIARGADVKGFELGDYAQAWSGQHMAYVKVKASDAFRLDKKVNLKDATFVFMAQISLQALRVSEIELGDYVGVLGLGVIGNLAAQLAQLQGAFVLGLDLEPRRVEKAKECGLRDVCVAAPASNRGIVDRFSGGFGLHCLIEATGNPRVLLDSLDLLVANGEVVLLGSPRDECRVNVTDLLQRIHLNRHGGLRFRGACSVPPARPKPRPGGKLQGDLSTCLRLIQEGRLRVQPLLTHVVRPDDAERVYRGLEQRPGEYLGVVYDWTLSPR